VRVKEEEKLPERECVAEMGKDNRTLVQANFKEKPQHIVEFKGTIT
jgi:hypothetical protein